MFTFFLAVSIMCWESKDIATIVILGFAWIVTALLLLWCIYASFEYTAWLVGRYEASKKMAHKQLSWSWKGAKKETVSERESV